MAWLGAALLLSVAAVPVAAEAIAPPSAAQAEAMAASPEDSPAKELLGIKGYEGRHYLHGDEWNSHLFAPHLKGVGGGYVGIGAEQGYLFVGWARSEFAWFVDYDALVNQIHLIHHAFFRDAATPDAFFVLWQDRKAGELALARQVTEAAKQDQLRKLYRHAQNAVALRMRQLRRALVRQKAVTFLTDAETYTWVRDLVIAGRTRVMSANLLETKGIVGIGDAARRMGVPIRTLYLSNAEEYWNYGKNFRANVQALPMDDRSVVIRTLSTFSINKDYRYVVQPGLKFQAFMAETWLPKIYRMIHRRPLKGPDDIDFVHFQKSPDDMRPKPRAAKGRGGKG